MNSYFLKLDNIFDLSNLTQHATSSTRTTGSTIDYIISSFTKPPISAESVSFIDHSLVNSVFTILSFPISHFKINKRPWSKFYKDSFITSFFQSSFDPLPFSDSNLFLTAFNNSLLESLDTVLPTKTSSFRLSSSEAPWFDSQCFSAKGAVWKLERLYRVDRSTTLWNKWQKELSSYRSLLCSKDSSFLIDSIKFLHPPSLNGAPFIDYKNFPPPLFFHRFFKTNKILSSINDHLFFPIFTKL